MHNQDPGGNSIFFGEQTQFLHHIINTIHAERNTHARQARHAEGSGQVVVAAATADAAHLHAARLHFKNSSGIIRQSACQRHIKLQVAVSQTKSLYQPPHFGQFGQALLPGGTFPEQLFQLVHLLHRIAVHRKKRL